jgi:hypothetical protein
MKHKPFYKYAQRNVLLKEIGFSSYQSYLKSELWQTIRLMALNRDAYKCFCGAKATEVHHQSYNIEVLIRKSLKSLISVCRKHHKLAEFDRIGDKRDLKNTRRKMRNLRRNMMIKQYLLTRNQYILFQKLVGSLGKQIPVLCEFDVSDGMLYEQG